LFRGHHLNASERINDLRHLDERYLTIVVPFTERDES